MPKSPDPFAAAMLAAPPKKTGAPGKILALWGDRPEVLEAIRSLRRDQGRSFAQIADLLAAEHKVNASTVQTWLKGQGIL